MNIENEKVAVATAMVKYGGEFVSALGNALFHADLINTQKIRETLPEFWSAYLEMSKHDR